MEDLNFSFYSADLVTIQIRLINNTVIDNYYFQVHNLYNEPITQPSPTLIEL